VTEIVSTEERDELSQHEGIIERGLKTFVDVGGALLAIRDKRLYRQDHGTFEDYCRERWGMERRHAYRLIDAADVVNNVSNWTQNVPTTESQVRPLTSLEPDQQVEVWQRAVETAPNGKVTAAHVQAVKEAYWSPESTVDTIKPISYEDEAEELAGDEEAYEWDDDDDLEDDDQPLDATPVAKPHVSHNSGNNEWYTPKEYIDAARTVMGTIDLDPATSEIANGNVQAAEYFTVDTNGLEQDWRGKVWMNPPYAAELVGRFAEKLCYHVETGDVTEAIVLVNNATETAWFQRMAKAARVVCFPKSRVRFWRPDGDLGAPLQGQAILYFGGKPQNFSSAFRHFGFVGVISV
jgi:phage N-6-adenine-methyltransferase